MNLMPCGLRQKLSPAHLRETLSLRTCFFCETRTGERICKPCLAYYKSLALKHSYTLTPKLTVKALYHYIPPFRDLILQVKIAGSLNAKRVALDLVRQNISTCLPRADVIIPAPSSLWSRLRGRHDFAWLLARQIANMRKALLIEPPLFLHWRLRKQAINRKTVNHQKPLLGRKALNLFTPKLTRQKILLVDDVVTTGTTLRHLASFFPNQEVSAFAFCLSPNHCFTKKVCP